MRCGAKIAVSKFCVNRTLCESCRNTMKQECGSYEHKKHRLKKHRFICEFCHKDFFAVHRKQRFCSGECHIKYKQKTTFDLADKTGEFEKRAYGEASRKVVRSYLEHKHGHVCSICGTKTWNGLPVPLIVDHIDGDPYNRKVENFRLVCPNCDAQLPTYKGKNKGRGRASRYKQQWYRTIKNLPASSN